MVGIVTEEAAQIAVSGSADDLADGTVNVAMTVAERAKVASFPADTSQAIADEALARAQADSNLQDNIDTESTSRIAADSALQAAIDALAALSHPLGTYADEAAIITAHTTADAGDYVINLETDTVWIWDAEAGPAAWVDSGTTASMTGSQIATALFAEDDTNNYSDAEKAKVDAALPASDVLDEDDFASNSATLPPSQQSTAVYLLTQGKAIAQAVARASSEANMGDNNESTGNAGTGGNISPTGSRQYSEISSGTTADNPAYRRVGVPACAGMTSQWGGVDYSFEDDLDVSQLIKINAIAAGTARPTEIHMALWGCDGSRNDGVRYADLDVADFNYNQFVRAEVRNDTVWLVALSGGVKSEAGGTYTVAANDELLFFIKFQSGTRVDLYIWDGSTVTLAASLVDNGTTIILPSSSGYTPNFRLYAISSDAGDDCRIGYSHIVEYYRPNSFFLVP